MNKKIQIAPSILSADFSCLSKEVAEAAKGGADIIHIDVMDGHFVPNISMGSLVVAAIKRSTSLPLDVHLMIENPEKYVGEFIKAGADWVSFHIEATKNPAGLARKIEESGTKAGITLNPETPISTIQDFLGELDYVVLMSVNPGFSSQKFIPEVYDKINDLRKLIDSQSLNVKIEVDGGISAANAGAVALKGADILVAGSAVFDTPNIPKAVQELRTATTGNPEPAR